MRTDTNNIVFIGQKGIPAEFVGTSGVEFYVEEKAKQFVSSGIKVTCYVRPWATPKNTREYNGVRIVHIPTINTKHLDAPLHSLFSTIHSLCTNVDTVWYQASGPALFSFIPKLFMKKVFVTMHTLEWKRDKWGPVSRLVLRLGERVGAKTADKLFAVSDDLAVYLRQKYHREVIVDPPSVQTIKKIAPDIITDKYGLKGNDYILYMGRFVPEKRIEWLIKAYQQIRPKGFKLVLAGGSSHTDDYEKELRNSAMNSETTTNNQIIFTGYVFGKEKQELLSNCKLFVLPSSVEGNPVVLKELPSDKPSIVYSGASYEEFTHEIGQSL